MTTSSNNLSGTKKGGYEGKKKNHHDRTNEHETNKDIKENMSYLNAYEKHVDDIEDFYEEHQEQKIKERNIKNVKYKDRQFDDYDSYLKYKQSVSKADLSKYPHTTEWDYLRNYSERDEMKMLEDDFKQMGVSEEELRLTILKGQKQANKNFNERYEGHLKILQSNYHLDESVNHSHNHLVAYGEVGKEGSKNPVTNINQSFEKVFGRFKTDENGNEIEIKMTRGSKKGQMSKVKLKDSDRWAMFHDINDRDHHECISYELKELARMKGYHDYEPPEFIRRDSDKTGIDHDVYKESKKKAAKDNDKEIVKNVEQHTQEINEYADELAVKEMKLAKEEKNISKREQTVENRHESLDDWAMQMLSQDEHLRKRKEDLEERERRADEVLERIEELNRRVDEFEEQKRIDEHNKSNYVKAGRMLDKTQNTAFEELVGSYNREKARNNSKALKMPFKSPQKDSEEPGKEKDGVIDL